MKKRNCRKSENERIMHERAVKIRKMTDEQICSYIDGLNKAAEASKSQNTNKTASNRVKDFIRHLDSMSGTGNGIGKSTVYKLQKFAEKEGYLN